MFEFRYTASYSFLIDKVEFGIADDKRASKFIGTLPSNCAILWYYDIITHCRVFTQIAIHFKTNPVFQIRVIESLGKSQH